MKNHLSVPINPSFLFEIRRNCILFLCLGFTIAHADQNYTCSNPEESYSPIRLTVQGNSTGAKIQVADPEIMGDLIYDSAATASFGQVNYAAFSGMITDLISCPPSQTAGTYYVQSSLLEGSLGSIELYDVLDDYGHKVLRTLPCVKSPEPGAPDSAQ